MNLNTLAMWLWTVHWSVHCARCICANWSSLFSFKVRNLHESSAGYFSNVRNVFIYHKQSLSNAWVGRFWRDLYTIYDIRVFSMGWNIFSWRLLIVLVHIIIAEEVLLWKESRPLKKKKKSCLYIDMIEYFNSHVSPAGSFNLYENSWHCKKCRWLEFLQGLTLHAPISFSLKGVTLLT